nr:MAG TPA: hypothetical protein [Bacteriophage sp.]
MQEVTSISQLNEYAKGQLVELPSFGEGQPFFARLRRPSMLALAKSGKIPNSLLATANRMFDSNLDTKNESMLKDFYMVMETILEAAFIEPTYQEIKDAGVQLSDDQMIFVFNYTQQGVRALDQFRPHGKNT